jgi:hypothetical protein
MLFEKLLELLAALAVAAAGIAGIGTASEHADPPANDAPLTHGPAQADEVEAIRAAIGDRVAAVLAQLDAAGLGPTDGLARAAEALTKAMENAPSAADQGLDTAMEAVITSPANDAPAGPPEERPGEVPAGPPADLPGGRP